MREPIQIDPLGNITLKVNVFAFFKVFVVVGLALSAGLLPIPELTSASRICLMLFVGAAGLWVTEAIPPFATAIMVIVLSVYLLGQPGGPLGLDASGYRMFLNPIASPVIVLFFGGLVLAMAATKHGFDSRLAAAFIKPFGTQPRFVLLGIILTTGVFSMFMSNTATTAMMIAILTPLFAHFEGRDNFKKAMVLAVPFAANIGGIGTIIGTPPNAVAASVLAGMGKKISFFEWAAVGIPLALILLFALWIVLITFLKPKENRFDILFPKPLAVTWDLVVVVVTFVLCILLWMTEPLTGLNASIVALLPVMVFTLLGIIDKDDLKQIDWDVLILVAGGLTLGVAMSSTGLSQLIVDQVSQLTSSAAILLVFLVLTSVILSNFMSHTSASNMIIPIACSLTVVSPMTSALAVAFACSMAMSLPISTPPNAIAFATKIINTRELAKFGTLTSLIGLVGVGIVLIILQNLWH